MTNSTAVQGLTSAEAAARLASEGPNGLPSDEVTPWWRTLLSVVREPMLLLLLSAGTLYLILGDVSEALTLLSFVVIVIVITLVQERKTSKALAALRDLSSPRAAVIRDGEKVVVAGREVVRGDVIVLGEGDRVAADAWMFEATSLHVDESLLTGESVAVRKQAQPRPTSGSSAPVQRPGGDDLANVYSGTLVVAGHGMAEVLATGVRTELGKIGTSLGTIVEARTPLQREVDRVVKLVTLIGLVACVVLLVFYGVTRGDWLRGLLAGIALAMAILPEEFPVVLSVFQSVGAWRMSKHNVLTRRVSTLELLGATTVLCTDKTGTLTYNKMRVASLVPGLDADDEAHEVGVGELQEAVHEIVEFGILASQRDPYDAMELAFHELGAASLASTEHLHASWTLIREYPLSPALLSVSQVWRDPEGSGYVIAAKGAPEAIADLCHLPADALARVQAKVSALAKRGLRVLGVARADFASSETAAQQHDYEFRWVGLVGLSDSIREGVPAAVDECTRAGIRVMMITGDHVDTARAIAAQAHLPAGEVVTGVELDAMSEAQLAERVEQVTVFARVVPEQKLRIVQALQARGAIVAMTGDGVNDAPALKAADIGVAMGGRGTDVAREAAALVITDDDFSSIVAALRLGRRVFTNLRHAMLYVIAVHVPIVGMALLPLFFGWPALLFPVHIVFLELVIDPACSIVFEAEQASPTSMHEPPRSTSGRVFGGAPLWLSALQGLSLLLAALGVFGAGLWAGMSEDAARGLSFATLMTGNVMLITINRSWTKSIGQILRTRNMAALGLSLGALVVLVVTLVVPPVERLFHFVTVGPGPIALAMLAGVASLAWFELWKWLRRRSPDSSTKGRPALRKGVRTVNR
jgi:Ca2+-transporting ATPase